MPSVDDILGAVPKTVPSVDQILGPPKKNLPAVNDVLGPAPAAKPSVDSILGAPPAAKPSVDDILGKPQDTGSLLDTGKDMAAKAFAPVKDTPGEYLKTVDNSIATMKQGVEELTHGHPFKGAWHLPLGAFEYVASPVDAGVKSLVGKPVSENLGGIVSPDTVTTAAEMFTPFGIEKAMGKGAMAAGKLATAAKEVPVTERISDDLFKLSNNRKADRIETSQWLQTVKDVPEATWEKLYHHEENPAVALTPEEKSIFDKLQPLTKEAEDNFKYLKKSGYDVREEGYTPRQVKGKGGPVDRLLGEDTAVGGRSLSKSATSLRPRSMFAMTDASGNRQVVMVKNGKVFQATPAGRGAALGEVIEKDVKNIGKGTEIVGKDGRKFKLDQARTAEIEGATKLEYHKNLLANRVTNSLQLRRAVDNAKFLKTLTKDPEFKNIAWRPGSKRAIPSDWREISGIPEFRGYRFKPEIAEVFEDYIRNAKNPEDLAGALYAVGRAAKASMFYNPIPHMRNVYNHLFVSRGLGGTAANLPSIAKHTYNAARAVMRQDKTYLDYLRSGASLPYADNVARRMQEDLVKAMGIAAKNEPKTMLDIAKSMGYNQVTDLIKGVYKASSNALWSFSDIASLSRIMELESKGLSRAEAIKEAESGIPNYRIPSRVGSDGDIGRGISRALQSPLMSMFGRYQYGRLKAYADTVGKLLRKDSTAAERLHAADQLAMMGFMMHTLYPATDKLAQKVTGNEDASVRRPGALSVPQSIADVAGGKRTFAQAAQSTLSPGILSTPLELYINSPLGLPGKSIYQPDDLAQMLDSLGSGDFEEGATRGGRVAFDLGKYALDKFAPVYQADKAISGDLPLKSFLGNQIGIDDPTDEQLAGREKGRRIRSRQAVKAAAKRGF